MLRVETFELRNWEEPVSGLILAENTEWVLLHAIPADYVLDGYKLLRKSVIDSRKRTEDHLLVERVLSLRGVEAIAPPDFQFAETAHMLNWVEQTYGLFEFQDDDEDDIVYGKIASIDDDDLLIHFVDALGSMISDYDGVFSLDAIRIIAFDSDYFKAVKLLWQHNPH